MLIFVEGESFNFDPIYISETAQKTFTIQNGGEKDLTLKRWELKGPHFSIDEKASTCKINKTLEESQSCKVNIIFHPKDIGKLQAEIDVDYSSDDENMNTQFYLSGEAKSALVADVGTSYDFQSIDLTLTGQKTFYLKNVSSSPIVLTPFNQQSLELKAPFFLEQEGTTCLDGQTLESQESCELQLTFAPDDRLKFSQNIKIHYLSNNKDYYFPISLSGKGNLNCDIQDELKQSYDDGEYRSDQQEIEDERLGREKGEALTKADGLVDGDTDGHAKGYNDTYQVNYNQSYDLGNKRGYTEGLQDTASCNSGTSSGRSQGSFSGNEDGRVDGKSDGNKDGYDAGEASGYSYGRNDGYDDGYYDGVSSCSSNSDDDDYDDGYDDSDDDDYDWDDDAWGDDDDDSGDDDDYVWLRKLTSGAPVDKFLTMCEEKGYFDHYDPQTFNKAFKKLRQQT